jgi:hypothetical protein
MCLKIPSATNAAPRTVSTVYNDESNNETPPGSDWVSPQASLDKRPIGKKLAKQMEQEEKILSNVTEKLKETFNNNNNNNGNATGTFHASALQGLTTTIAKCLQRWNERQPYSNASPTLNRKYDNLGLRACIRELEKDDDATSTNNNIVLMADTASYAQRHHGQRIMIIPVAASSKNNVGDNDDDGIMLAHRSVPAISFQRQSSFVDDDLTQSQF